MTKKQKRFVDPSVKKDEAARANASRLLTNANVKKYISDQLEKIHNQKTADAQEVIEYLTSVLRGESTSQEIVVEGIGDGMSEARTMEKGPSEKDRLRAAELLGKRYSLFTNKLEVSGLEEEKKKLGDILEQLRGGG